MSELMRLMMLMKGDKQPQGTDQQEKIRMIEENQKMKNEAKREKEEHKAEMEKMKNEFEDWKAKHKTKIMKENNAHQKKMNEEAQKQADVEDAQQHEQHEFEMKKQRRKTKRSRSEGEHQTEMLLEKEKELELDEEGVLLDDERRAAQHKLDTKQQEVEQIKKSMHIEDLKAQLRDLYSNTTKTMTELNQYNDVNDRSILNLINQLNAHLTSIQNYASNDVLPLLKKLKETKTLSNTLAARNLPQQLEQGVALHTALEVALDNATAKLNYQKDLNKKVLDMKYENKKLEDDKTSYEKASNGIKLQKVEITGKNSQKSYQFVPVRDILQENKAQNVIKKKELERAQNSFERASNKVLESDRIEDENQDMQAEITQLSKVTIEDMTDKLASLKFNRDSLIEQKNGLVVNKKRKNAIKDEIEKLNNEIGELDAYVKKLNANPGTPVKLDQIANLKYQRKQLEDEMDDINVDVQRKKQYEKQIQDLTDQIAIKTAEVAKMNESKKQFNTPKLLKSYGEAKNDLENTERDADKAMKERKRLHNLEDETAETQFQNNKDTAVLNAKDDQGLQEAEKKAVEENVKAEYKKLLNQQKRKTADAEREARAQEKETAMLNNDKQIQESNDQIVNELAQQEIYKERMKKGEEVKNKIHEKQIKQNTYNAMNKAGNALKPLDDGIAKIEGDLAAINYELDQNTNILMSEGEYVVNKQKELRDKFSQNMQLDLRNLNQYLEHAGKKMLTNPDDVNKFKDKLSIDALEQMAHIVADSVNANKEMEDVDNMEGIDTLLPYFKNKDEASDDALSGITDSDFFK